METQNTNTFSVIEQKENKINFKYYFALVLVIFFGTTYGYDLLRDFSRSFIPENESWCSDALKSEVVSNMENDNLQQVYDISKCNYSAVEKKNGIDSVLKDLLPLYSQRQIHETDLKNLTESLSKTNRILADKVMYLDTISVDKNINIDNFEEKRSQYLEKDRSQYIDIQNQIVKKKQEKDEINYLIYSVISKNKPLFDAIKSESSSLYKITEIKRASVSFLIAFVTFLVTFRMYKKSKKENNNVYSFIYLSVVSISTLIILFLLIHSLAIVISFTYQSGIINFLSGI